ncbi:MAG: glycoside hydrolase family 32 protein [Ferruginibacter sp.]
MKFENLILRICVLIMPVIGGGLSAQSIKKLVMEQHRPQVHFSPKAHWVNDPNGMVYHKGVYHLFFQYYPDSTIWGPMHWGHATSKDLVNWQEQPIALYPDSLGYIFSGSAVVDKNNTSGFGKNGQVPMVAIFTHHDPVAEKEKRIDMQHQSIAYSLDDGKTWTKYAGNPVIKNPGISDFRDPKVMWYESQKKWVMTLATKDCITFYSSPDLKNWKHESEFGKGVGAHGGVWECPDLFSLDDNGKKVWGLIVSINPGGPNKGSATQYFLGDFDGHTFSPFSTDTKWADYGPDDYAGITWSNTGDRKIFLGWMSNWLYAQKVPTEKWRSAMTIPRELKLKHVGNDLLLASQPVPQLSKIQSKPVVVQNMKVTKSTDISGKTGTVKLPCRINLEVDQIKDFSLVISNDIGEEIVVGFDKKQNQYFIDRTTAGKKDFHNEFAARHIAPRFTKSAKMNMILVIDVSSIELFADDGLSVMTSLFFPNAPYNKISIRSAGIVIKKMEYLNLANTWHQ